MLDMSCWSCSWRVMKRMPPYLILLFSSLPWPFSIKFNAYNGVVICVEKLLSRMLGLNSLSVHCCLTLLHSGTSAVSPDGKLLLVGNLSTGMELYKTTDLSCLRVFKKPNLVNVPKQVGYIPGSQLLMSGSDCGLVLLWNHDGKPVQNLCHSSCE